MTRYISHFESAIDGTLFPADCEQTWHAGRPLWSRYDLEAVGRAVTPALLQSRPWNMWRYRELLPIGDEIEPVSLDEPCTPIVKCPVIAKRLGLADVRIKDESRLPSCSFKARGMSLALTMARHFGAKRVAMASNGNAGGAMALYAARAGLQSFILVPHNTPRANLAEAWMSKAQIYCADGQIDQCGKLVREGHDRGLWFDISTMKEPYRLEGKKTMGLELAEQFNWELPDVILYPTGGGTALIAMWKAFHELQELGWLKTKQLPRMISVQSTGCPPLVRAFESGARFVTRVDNANTAASGLRVPQGIGDFMVLDAVRESGGLVVASEESKIVHWQQSITSTDGVYICPETATCIGALEMLSSQKKITAKDRVVIFNTAAGQKYMEHLNFSLPSVRLAEFDWARIESDMKNPG